MHPRRARQSRAFIITLVLCAVGICGCGNGNRSIPLEDAPSGPEPIIATARSGLEVHWWLTRDLGDAVAARLGAHLEPALPRDPALRDRWRGAGLRMVRAPVTELVALQRDLPATHIRRRQWVGWATRWVEIFRGRRAGGAVPLLIDGRRERFDPGTFRLLLRAWPEPHPQDHAAPALRLELAVQLHQNRALEAAELLEEPRISPAQDQGFIFRSLTLETTLEDGYIYVITAEAPDVTWTPHQERSPGAGPAPKDSEGGSSTGAEPRAQTETEDSSSDVEPSAPVPFGPPVTSPMTIGQAMMTASDTETRIGLAKVVLVILPRAPERFRLLPEINSGQ